ncbi:MAG: Xaa-Pro peptidase family protein [Actinomycetota bacterium]|nr:Xaa-Pro peptidase family protein [Actinomycetota bacterium]
MNPRVERLRERLEEPLLVSSPVNVRYLTGLHSSNAAVLVEPERVRLFSDFRYREAGNSIVGAEFTETKRDTYANLAELLDGRIAFESTHLTYARYETLQAGGLDLVPRQGLVEELRVVKDEEELAAIGRAAAITDEAYERLAVEQFSGRSERDFAWRMNELMHELGADAPAFEVIVAAGANGARPHADPGDRTIEQGDAVVVDAGAMKDGYCSDCTRTFAVGPLGEALQHAYDVCFEAQLAGLQAARVGQSGVEVDAVARKIIDDAGFGENFGHGLGHGVGLDVHEAPRLAQSSSDTLAPGNVVTIEPGIYLEGIGGIRIEDLVVVTEDGPDVLSSYTKELVEVA